MLGLGLMLQVRAPGLMHLPAGQELDSGKSCSSPPLMTQTPQILTLPLRGMGQAQARAWLFVTMWRALFPLILLCGVGHSSLAKKDPTFVPTGSPQRLDTQAGLWGLRILSSPPQWVVFYFQLLGGL